LKGRSSWISTSAASGFRGQCRQAWPSATREPYTSQKVSQTAWRGSSLDLSFRGQRRQAWPSATPEPYTSSKTSQTALRGSSLDPSFQPGAEEQRAKSLQVELRLPTAGAVRAGRASGPGPASSYKAADMSVRGPRRRGAAGEVITGGASAPNGRCHQGRPSAEREPMTFYQAADTFVHGARRRGAAGEVITGGAWAPNGRCRQGRPSVGPERATS
jgi:hypothetical protein